MKGKCGTYIFVTPLISWVWNVKRKKSPLVTIRLTISIHRVKLSPNKARGDKCIDS